MLNFGCWRNFNSIVMRSSLNIMGLNKIECRPDTSHIFVDVGLGFHVEFTRSEALNFTATKEEQISRYLSPLESI